MKQIQVAAAVIVDENNQLFIAKRPENLHQGGKWEFPGGKLEAEESADQALQRELFEEIGIKVVSAERFMQISFDYPDKSVVLNVFLVTQYSGTAWGKEGQDTDWVSLAKLRALDFPAANKPIIEKLERWLVQ